MNRPKAQRGLRGGVALALDCSTNASVSASVGAVSGGGGAASRLALSANSSVPDKVKVSGAVWRTTTAPAMRVRTTWVLNAAAGRTSVGFGGMSQKSG